MQCSSALVNLCCAIKLRYSHYVPMHASNRSYPMLDAHADELTDCVNLWMHVVSFTLSSSMNENFIHILQSMGA